MARASREVWTKRVQRWRESDLTAKEYASEIGVKASTLTYWSWKLRAEQKEVGSASKPAPKKRGGRRRSRGRAQSSEMPPLTLVELAPPPSASAAPASLEVVVSDLVIRVPVGFDEETLGRLLGVARRAS